jgi:hypothetical protein
VSPEQFSEVIVAERFVFLHLHKSGGTFVNDFLLRFATGARRVGYHLPRSLVPPECAHLPVLGFVRNPWEFYVSWFAFQSGLPAPNVLFRTSSENGRLNFERTIVNLLELGTTGRHLDALVALLPTGYAQQGFNVPRFALEKIRSSGLGLYSFLYRHVFDGPGVTIVRRTERLRAEMISMLAEAGEPVTASMRRYLADAPDSNASCHASYASYYGRELRDLVAARDADVIARHGFEYCA